MSEDITIDFAAGSMPRLLVSCATYRRKFGQWPTQMRAHSMLLKVWAEGLSEREWEQLTCRMEVRSSWKLGSGVVSVGGVGVVVYDEDIDEADWAETESVKRWLRAATPEAV